jgi:hypothetical protein
MDMSALDAALGAGPMKKHAGPIGAAPPMGEPDGDEPEAGEVAMQEYMDAQTAGDAAGAWSAFKSMVALAGGPMSEE